jgi:hypothetical protein
MLGIAAIAPAAPAALMTDRREMERLNPFNGNSSIQQPTFAFVQMT